MIYTTRLATASFAAWLIRLRVLLSISLAVTGLASVSVLKARRLVATWLVSLHARMGRLLAKSFKLSAGAAAKVSVAPGFVTMWLADLLTRLRLSLIREAARATIEAARAGVTRLIAPFAHMQTWLRSSVMLAFLGAARAAIEIAQAGVTRVLDVILLVRGLLPVLMKLCRWAATNVIVAPARRWGPSPKKPTGGRRYRVAASVAAWVTSCWAASHWLARCVRAVSRTFSALAN